MRRTPLPAPEVVTATSTPAPEPSDEPASPVYLTFRDPVGTPFVLEIRTAGRWQDAYLDPPVASVADVRAVTLLVPEGPAEVPGWLAVIAGPPPTAWGGTAQALWPASPHYRDRGAAEAEFRAAGVAALRHASSRVDVLDPLTWMRTERGEEALHGPALGRWLHVEFGTPERFATMLLIRRIAERDPEAAAALTFLHEASVPEGGTWAELAVDRRVLLEQATPWRYFDRTFAPALAALAAWRHRYEAAYARHYAGIRDELVHRRTRGSRLLARACTADRLASILGAGGRPLAARVRRALEEVARLPTAPIPGHATTGGIRLGQRHAATGTLDTLAGEVEEALDDRLRALSAALAHRVLDGAGDGLTRVLGAIQASDVNDLDRVLDDRLAAHLARVVCGGAGGDPLADVAARFPEVRAGDLDAAAEAFREALFAAVHGAPDGVARLAR